VLISYELAILLQQKFRSGKLSLSGEPKNLSVHFEADDEEDLTAMTKIFVDNELLVEHKALSAILKPKFQLVDSSMITICTDNLVDSLSTLFSTMKVKETAQNLSQKFDNADEIVAPIEAKQEIDLKTENEELKKKILELEKLHKV
jgi:hypothetical protein